MKLLKILPDEIELMVADNTVLANALMEAGFSIQLACGGAGVCGKCKVRFLNDAPPVTLQEETLLSAKELAQGYRLACVTRLDTDYQVLIPDTLRLGSFAVKDALSVKALLLKSPVQKIALSLNVSALKEAESELTLITRILKEDFGYIKLKAEPHVLAKIPQALRTEAGKLTVTIFEDHLLDIEPGDQSALNFGLAIDLGTTTIGMLLLNLNTGETLDYAVFPNPQSAFGADLISRISFAGQNYENCRRLQAILQAKIVEVVQQFCLQHQILPSQIYLTGVAGNSVMTHLFWGINPKFIGTYPFKPVVSEMLSQYYYPLGRDSLTLPFIFSFPLIGGFVGGDVVADLLTTNLILKDSSENSLLIDIGTNCEVVLKSGKQILAASAPAGPALEGANISQGMRAVPGALVAIKRQHKTIEWETINNEPPIGICGSGLFHIIHFLKEEGLVNEEGLIQKKTVDPFWQKRVVLNDSQAAKILLVSKQEGAATDIYLTQQDIRQFQLANGAISSAWYLLCTQLGVEPLDIQAIFIAGAFGNFIKAESLIVLGTIPAIPKNRIKFIGNGSLEGVREAILDTKRFTLVQQISKEITFIELASDPHFQEVFVEHLKLKQRAM